MLTQYTISLSAANLHSVSQELGYRLYAALLEQAASDFGDAAHTEHITPVSQYVRRSGSDAIWTVNLLGVQTEEKISPVLESADSFFLRKSNSTLRVKDIQVRRLKNANELFQYAAGMSGTYKLSFHTTTAFKSAGKYVTLPSMRLLVQSIIGKWNGSVYECPIEDTDGEGATAIAEGLICKDFHLDSSEYYLKGHPITGFVGTMTIENQLSGFHRRLADALMCFCDFSGVGIKTTLGMGGVSVKEK